MKKLRPRLTDIVLGVLRMAEDKSSPQEYMSATDYVTEWNMPKERADGEIAGAAKFNGAWIIPVNTEKPLVKRRLSRPVIPMSKLQEAVLEHIENGDDFDVKESTVGGKSFIVSSVYTRQGPVLEELLAQFMVSMLGHEHGMRFNPKGIAKLKAKLRKKSNAAKETYESYMQSYRDKLKSYGFSDEDTEVLLEKIAADYEPFIL